MISPPFFHFSFSLFYCFIDQIIRRELRFLKTQKQNQTEEKLQGHQERNQMKEVEL